MMSNYEEKRNAYLNNLPKDKRLAMKLHHKFCHDNHTDMCGWFYEIKNGEDVWTDSEHSRWLKKANELLRVSDFDTIVSIINLL